MFIIIIMQSVKIYSPLVAYFTLKKPIELFLNKRAYDSLPLKDRCIIWNKSDPSFVHHVRVPSQP